MIDLSVRRYHSRCLSIARKPRSTLHRSRHGSGTGSTADRRPPLTADVGGGPTPTMTLRCGRLPGAPWGVPEKFLTTSSTSRGACWENESRLTPFGVPTVLPSVSAFSTKAAFDAGPTGRLQQT
jgi:hypothetical protein